jgi:hypothetical protein
MHEQAMPLTIQKMLSGKEDVGSCLSTLLLRATILASRLFTLFFAGVFLTLNKF